MVKINNFSISNVQQMLGEDGYVIRCDLKIGGTKVGEYFDPGNGAPSLFYPEKGCDGDAIEKEIASWGQYLNHTYLDGKPMDWELPLLVEELLNRTDLAKLARRQLAKSEGCVIGTTGNGLNYICAGKGPKETFDDVETRLMKATNGNVKDMIRLNSIEDLNITDKKVLAKSFLSDRYKSEPYHTR